jgi:hypothetical protein
MSQYSDVGFSLKSIKKSLKKLGGGGKKKKVTKPQLLTSDAQGGTAQRLPLGFPQIVFVNGGVTTQTVTVNPQKPFMPRRLICNAVLNGVSPRQVVLSAFTIGTEDMLAGAGVIPVEAFASDATDMILMTRAARPGLLISLRFDINATPAALETVTVSSVLIGDAVAQ